MSRSLRYITCIITYTLNIDTQRYMEPLTTSELHSTVISVSNNILLVKINWLNCQSVV